MHKLFENRKLKDSIKELDKFLELLNKIKGYKLENMPLLALTVETAILKLRIEMLHKIKKNELSSKLE